MPPDESLMPSRPAAMPSLSATAPEPEALQELQGLLTAMAGRFGLVAAAGVVLLAWA